MNTVKEKFKKYSTCDVHETQHFDSFAYTYCISNTVYKKNYSVHIIMRDMYCTRRIRSWAGVTMPFRRELDYKKPQCIPHKV